MSAPPRAGTREWVGLAVLALPCLIYAMDLTVLNFAVPALTRDLKPTASQLLWIMDIYGFLIAGLLVTMGTLGDRIGRRRLLMIGATLFAGASLLAAFSQSAGQLIAARAVLGVAGATLAPSTLSLIRNMFLDEGERRTAIAVWIAGFSAGTAAGPVVGGVLLEHFWWGSVFLVNVPAMGLLIVLGLWLLPEYRSDHTESIDLASAALSIGAVLSIIFGIKEFATAGAGLLPFAAVALGTLLAFVFLRRQRDLAHPFVDFTLFDTHGFRAALLVNVAGAFFIAGIYLFMAQYLQLVIGLTPFVAAMWSLPSALAFIVGSGVVPVLAHRWGVRRLMVAGLLIASVGFAMILGVHANGPVLLLVSALVVFSFGFTPVASLTTDLVVGAAPPARAGAAAALSETAFEFGGALGIALLGSLGAAIYRSRMAPLLPAGLDEAAARATGATLGGAVESASGAPALLEAAKTAFTSGMLTAAGIGCVCLLLLAVYVHRALRENVPE